MKKYNFILILLAFFAIQSCDSTDAYFGGEEDDITNPDVFSRLADIIKFDNVPTDTIAFDSTVDSEIVGSFGLRIHIPANSCTGGSGDPTQLFVVLREYPTIQKMAMSNVQTISNQELLVTGGNFWWKIIDAEGNDWALADPSPVTAEQPIQLDMQGYGPSAAYYIGNVINQSGRDALNWTLANGAEGSMNQENNLFTYYGLKLNWANCDALYNYSDNRTQFGVTLNTDANIVEGEEMVMFIIDDFPSVITIPRDATHHFTTYADSIPVGISGTLIAVALDADSNIHLGSTQITVAGDDAFQIDMTQGDIAQLQSLINNAAN